MKVAVLMSTYNGHNYLKAQLESLCAQTIAKDMTVYIRDDGSTDDTFDIIENWKDKMNIVLYKQGNVGPAMSFWSLMTNPEIKADYYAFCDQDDVWYPDKLEVAITQLKGNVHFYACNCKIIDETGKIIRERRVEGEYSFNYMKMFVSGCTQGCSMVFTDALREYVNSKSIECISMHDMVLILYAVAFGELYWDTTPRFGYRVHSDNVVAKNNKSITKRVKTTYKNWMSSSKHSMAQVAAELLQNTAEGSRLTAQERALLAATATYKSHRVAYAKRCANVDVSFAEKRSFVARVLLGLY